MEFFATCPKGFEHLLAGELGSLGLERVRPLAGQVSFEGGLEAGYRACLWSALASRVTLVLGRFPAQDADELYEGAAAIPWEEHVLPGTTVAVDAHGTNAQLRNTQFSSLRTKDAIADRVLARQGTRLMTDPSSPDLRIVCRIGRTHATVGIDLSGEPLFHRSQGRHDGRLQDLRADYAAALLAAGGWYRDVRHGDASLVAAFPGAGTLVLEAAREALGQAPGLARARWGFAGWAGHDEAVWQDLLDEARTRAEEGSGRTVRILAADLRRGAESALRDQLRANGLAPELTFADLRHGDALPAHPGAGLLVADLSWLEPDEAAVEAQALAGMHGLARILDIPARAACLARDAATDAVLGCDPAQVVGMMAGSQEATLRTYELADEPAGHEVSLKDGTRVPVLVPASDQFAARLAKVARLRRRWAQREDVTCYRVYDADLPDYAVTLDLYQESELTSGGNAPHRWLQVSEYAAPKDVDPALARARLLDVLAIAPRVLDVRPKDCFLRVRSHGKGGSQYADEGRASSGHAGDLPAGAHLVDEGGLTFEVNFSSRLDCGIFLDHRDTRAMLREMAKQTQGSKRFLNLFAYTGTATCYAADGGCKHTTTVDLSRPSLEWARRNMERNGFKGPQHEYVQADVVSWVNQMRHTANRWDLVFCDVPTFSNSSRMGRASWDVQRDHAELLIDVSRVLTRNGVCVFSCNLRSFKPDVETLERAGVRIEDITDRTIPEDFQRNRRVHHCYLVQRG